MVMAETFEHHCGKVKLGNTWGRFAADAARGKLSIFRGL
jgi:hypothetical protein